MLVLRQCARRPIGNASALKPPGNQHPVASGARAHSVELCPAVRVDLRIEILADLEIGSWPQFQGHQTLGAGAQTVADIVS
jgi:hypothetical protein